MHSETILKYADSSKKKPFKVTKDIIKRVVTELVGEEALPIVYFLRGKTFVSEFIVAEDLNIEIHKTRNLLYRLLEKDILSFRRKKDKKKGWYICYWDFNEHNIPHLVDKIRKEKLEKLKTRLAREEASQFFMCPNACSRLDFESAIESGYHCPECNELLRPMDNNRTKEFLMQRIAEMEENPLAF